MAFTKLSAIALIALSAVSTTSAQAVLEMSDFKAGIEANQYDMIIDVRSASEWDEGHIAGAINVPMATFTEDALWKNMQLQSEQDPTAFSCSKSCATIAVHCKRGVKSKEAIAALKDMGFEGTIYDAMGTQNWVDAGYELTTADDVVEPVCASSDICPSVAAVNVTAIESSASSSKAGCTLAAAALAIPAFLAVL